MFTTRVLYNEIAPGAVFAGRYRICDELGRGGLGRVYKAIDREISEAVALKVLRPEISLDETMIERFRNELKLARRISHKNVCRIYDLGNSEGTYFITMEYIPGDNLKSIIQMMGPLSPARALAIAGQVCDGVAEAHRLGVIHRDLKTSNIMIDRGGSARITDFGIACTAATKGLTERGALIGTPEYMAPEQVEGEDVDHRADIYSLGIILFEMITGRVPFEGNTPLSIALMQKSARPPDPRDLNAQAPEALSAVIAKCLEKDRAGRYQGVEALASDLRAIGEGLAGSTTGLHPGKADSLTPGGTRVMNSIAVLPFADLSPQKDQDYFCEGLAEEIITALTKITDLDVAAKSSAFSSKIRHLDVREIGRQLGVATVLEGSVRKGDRGLRITAQLINVATGYHVWSEKYERNLEDIFTIQDEITLAIVERLRVKLFGDEKALLLRRHTDNPEAYNLYLKGRYLWNKRTAESMQKALECFHEAIRIDPDYALAYTGISDCYMIIGSYFMPPRAAFTRARDAALKAMEIAPDRAEVHNSLAFVKEKLERDWKGAEQEYKRALEIDPNYTWAHHWYSIYLGTMGRHEESLAEIRRALAIDPISAPLNMIHGVMLHLARSFDRAAEELKKVISLDPTYILAYLYLGLSYVEKGEYEEGLATLRQAADLAGQAPFFAQAVGYGYAVSGQTEMARHVLAGLHEAEKKVYVSPVFMGLLYFKLGETDRGFAYLDKAYEDGDHWLEYIKVYPGFDVIRREPLYAALLQRLKLE
jgi:serine/threonine protein kinase/Tfp pilus assembly protein PilF